MIYDFEIEPDEQGLVAAARSTLERLGAGGTRSLEDADSRAELAERAWSAFVDQGWHLLGIPEASGGLGMAAPSIALLLEESGRHLIPGSLASSLALVTPLVVSASSGPVSAEVLGEIADGRPATAVWGTDENAVEVIAQDVAAHGLLLVVREVPGEGASIAVFEPQVDRATAVRGYDDLHPTVRVDLAGLAPRRMVAQPMAVDVARRTALTLLAAELVGIAGRAVELAVEHAIGRTQFGQPIGSFQGIKHALADTHVQVERARSLVYAAASAAAVDDEPLGLGGLTLAQMAKGAASDAAVDAASLCVQVLGAMGTTAEHDAIWVYRRARQAATRLGDGRRHFGEVGRALCDAMELSA